MNIFDVLNAPWAIEPSKLIELHAIYGAHVRGEHIDIEAVEKRLGRPMANEQKDYEIVDGVAVVPINGVIAKKMNMFSQISGGASSQLAMRAIDGAKRDQAVHSIMLHYDNCPGGTVDGTELFANAVKEARKVKPIVALGAGMIASAGYWSGSAAQKVYIVDGTTAVGSIGVVAAHKDISAAEAARGIKTTEISAGKFKRIASQYGPLSDEGRQSIQDQLDYMYSLFVGAVADHRSVAPEKVLADMADGRIFTGQQAVDAGLVDGIMTFDALIAKLNDDRQQGGRVFVPGRAPAASTTTIPKGENIVTPEEMKAAHPAVVQGFIAEGAAAERARIQAVESQLIPGHEALIAGMKFDGKSTAGDAAQAVLAAERTSREAHARASAADAPLPVVQVPAAVLPAAQEQEPSRQELDAKAKTHMAANPGMTYVAAYKAVGGK
ncbi:S49 family peptidase [Duganella sp. CT11-25]|uniref:S49 family peptidase n=1 Tax=unclassified Duganella TaxID=2636909 RepID=UPI0039B00019